MENEFNISWILNQVQDDIETMVYIVNLHIFVVIFKFWRCIILSHFLKLTLLITLIVTTLNSITFEVNTKLKDFQFKQISNCPLFVLNDSLRQVSQYDPDTFIRRIHIAPEVKSSAGGLLILECQNLRNQNYNLVVRFKSIP